MRFILVLSFFPVILPMPAQAALSIPGFESPSAIIRGEKARPEEPVSGSAVQLVMPGGRCTGTVIAPTTILTAAHCVPESDPYMVAVFRPRGSEDCGKSPVTEVAFAPGSVKPEGGDRLPDIALLHLAQPLCGTTPSALRRDPVAAGETVQVAGFGVGTPEDSLTPNRISLRTSAIDKESLTKLLDGLEIAEGADDAKRAALVEQLAATSALFQFALPLREKTSFCFGDSGGPTFQVSGKSSQLVGVNAAFLPHKAKGTGECKFAYLHLFTPVAPFVEWIDAVKAEWSK